MAITTINRDIAEDEIFNHKGSVRLKGNIGKNAKVIIEDGGLHVEGFVADGAYVHAKGKQGSVLTVGNDIVGGVIVINGRIVSGGDANSDELSGLTIEKAVGDNVELHADNAIALSANAGTHLIADAGNSFSAERVGAGAVIDSGNSTKIAVLDAGSSVEAGNSVKISKIGEDCVVWAGNSIKASSIGKNAKVRAGNSIKADAADMSAQLKAGNKVKVERYTGSGENRSRGGSSGSSPRFGR